MCCRVVAKAEYLGHHLYKLRIMAFKLVYGLLGDALVEHGESMEQH
jgi:hypothetical protein